MYSISSSVKLLDSHKNIGFLIVFFRFYFQFALLRNAGHSAPMDQPQRAVLMVEQFVRGEL